MLKPGTSIKMTKGYKGVRGVIVSRTGSRFELYIIKLDNGLNLIAGSTSFIPLERVTKGSTVNEYREG